MNTTTVLMPLAIMLFVIVLDLLIFYLVPRLTRPDIYFAVTVPPDFRDSADGRAILSRYRLELIISSAIALAIVLATIWLPRTAYLEIVPLAGVFLQLAGVFFAYYRARRRVQPHAVAPVTVREAELAPHEVRLPGGWLVQIPPFALLAFAALWLRLHWDTIPDRFPIHWGINGQPNGWATRSIQGVYAPLEIAAVIGAGMAFLAYAMLRWSRLIRVRGPASIGERRFRHVVVSILVATEYFLAILFTWVGLLPLAHNPNGPPGLIPFLLFELVFTVVIIALLIRLGQGGSRLASVEPVYDRRPAAAPVGDRTADRYWKLGVVYVNRDDPALFVEKRFGLGYTINFGHNGAWVFLAALVAIVVLTILLVPSQHH
jgi:uncharacterized membrane protein